MLAMLFSSEYYSTMYSILIHELGQFSEGRILRVDRATISSEHLAYNLDNLWAWADCIESDGPCVAIEFYL